MVSLVNVPHVRSSDTVDAGLMHVEYVKTCSGCGTVFTSGTGSAFCGSVCFAASVEKVSARSARLCHPLVGVRLPRLTGGRTVAEDGRGGGQGRLNCV